MTNINGPSRVSLADLLALGSFAGCLGGCCQLGIQSGRKVPPCHSWFAPLALSFCGGRQNSQPTSWHFARAWSDLGEGGACLSSARATGFLLGAGTCWLTWPASLPSFQRRSEEAVPAAIQNAPGVPVSGRPGRKLPASPAAGGQCEEDLQ